ncbi:MAG TPA: efflux RND transporter periplasmic adaptor subunit [Planctomycetota bacterium]|nr:efflux RND transporter periplasmic adaptor subunit [Planctomycetota bacterium]
MRLPARLPVLVIALALVGCGSKPPGQGGAHGQMPPPPTPVAAVLERDVPVLRELTGRIEALHYVELRPRVSGVVEKVVVPDGVEVKAGDVILEIDQRPLLAAVARGEAEVARAEARLAQAQAQLKRGDELKAKDVIAPQQYDDLAAAVRTSTADQAAAKAALETVKLELGYARVVAPIDGRIGKVQTTVGNLVQGGGPVPATLITSIVSVDPVDVVFDLDEATWRVLGDTLRAAQSGGAAVPVKVGVAGEPGHPHPGSVRFVDNAIDTASGSIRLRASVANPTRVLTPGAFARVQLQIEAPKATLLVHERAVLTQQATRFVMIVDDQGLTEVRPVKLGDAVGHLRVVVDGLEAGERIAVGGDPIAKFGMLFFPGMPVTPVPASMETLEPLAAPEGAAPGHAAPATAAPAAPVVDTQVPATPAQAPTADPATAPAAAEAPAATGNAP